MFLALLAFEPPPAQAAWPGRPGGGGDDTYQFAEGFGQQLVATVTSTASGARVMVQLSPVKAWDTALLGVRLNAKARDPKVDPNVDPYVDISVGSARVRQHLDPGAHGLRWLNLTGLRGSLAPGAMLELQASAVRIESGDATLRLFASAPPPDGRMLVLAPHPDDAEIAAFGLYTDRNATIVTVTSGNAGDANYAAHYPDPAEQYRMKGYLRAVTVSRFPGRAASRPSAASTWAISTPGWRRCGLRRLPWSPRCTDPTPIPASTAR